MTPEQKEKRNAYMRAYLKKWMANAPPEKKERWRRMRAANQAAHPETSRAKAKRFRDKIREQVLTAYGGACVCCGENEYVFLTIDHIVPIKRARGRDSSYEVCLQLRKEGYPTGYQILCYNCNHAKKTGDECPHRLIVRRKLMLVGPRPV